MLDSLMENTCVAEILPLLEGDDYFLATIHRQENTDDMERLERLLQNLEEIESAKVLFPLHPRTKERLDRLGISIFTPRQRIVFLQPTSYLGMLHLEKHAKAIITDSGGVQKEAYYLKVPCVTLRNETEWPETVESGWNTLVGDDREKLLRVVEKSKATPTSHDGFYGDGKASEKIVDILMKGVR